jgi:hypothetical protein
MLNKVFEEDAFISPTPLAPSSNEIKFINNFIKSGFAFVEQNGKHTSLKP